MNRVGGGKGSQSSALDGGVCIEIIVIACADRVVLFTLEQSTACSQTQQVVLLRCFDI